MISSNRQSVVYNGDRPAIEKLWESLRYGFEFGKPVSVPETLADILLGTGQFVLADDYGRPMLDVFPGGGLLVLRRWGALGDLIMFRVAVSAVKRACPTLRPILRCQERFVEVFMRDPLWEAVYGIGKPNPHKEKPDGNLTFDQVVEQDHKGREEHRIDLFLKSMSKETIVVTPQDWNIPIPPGAISWVKGFLDHRKISREQRGTRKLIAVQIHGSGAMKTLPDPVVKLMLQKIRAAGHSILLVEPDDAIASKFVIDADVHKMPHRDALHMIQAMKSCDLVVTMDSGALWMAHCAMAPLFAILGPTRARERISYHPTGKANYLALNEMIECPACFESATRCNYRYDCMQTHKDPAVPVTAIMAGIEDALAGRKHYALPVVQRV